MTLGLKAVFLAGGAALILATAAGLAAEQKTPDTPMQGLERSNERAAERLLRDYDRNKDGRVTHDEMNRLIGWQFAVAAHHAKTMTMEQFLQQRAGVFRPRNVSMFRRLDWNSDGKLTEAEYGAPQRVRFIQLDRDGAGFVSCGKAAAGASYRSGVSAFCRDNDTDMDGRVTKAELDAAQAQRFSEYSGGAAVMTEAQYVIGEQRRFAPSSMRQFRKLDTDEDGVLTVREFGASEVNLFIRLDRNNDGVLSADELHPKSKRVANNGSERRS